MLLAAFTIAPAAAQGEPQVGEIDADGVDFNPFGTALVLEYHKK